MRTLAVTIALIMSVTPPLIAQTQECAETTIPKVLPPAHEIVDSDSDPQTVLCGKGSNHYAPETQVHSAIV